MDSRATKTPDQVDAHFADFCDRIFALPWLRYSVKLMTCERNTGHEAGRLAAQFSQRQNTCCIKQFERSDYGWTTGPGGTPKTKYMAALLDAFRRDAIVYMDTMVCTEMPGDADAYGARIAKLQAEFEAQLARMQQFVDIPEDAFGKIRTGVSGKLDPDGRVIHGLNDDLAMSFAMSVYIIHQLISNSIETIDPSFQRRLVYGRGF